ncbi:hypothetical protein [Methylobacterium sp. Leaf125]|nr:hypothetical protein [Methylobacterium sp. Leaf125]
MQTIPDGTKQPPASTSAMALWATFTELVMGMNPLSPRRIASVT